MKNSYILPDLSGRLKALHLYLLKSNQLQSLLEIVRAFNSDILMKISLNKCVNTNLKEVIEPNQTYK